MRGASDHTVLSKAVQEKRVIVTNDNELVSLAMLQRPPDVILLRLSDERTSIKLRVVRKVLGEYADKIEVRLIVASERSVRIRPRLVADQLLFGKFLQQRKLSVSKW